MPNQRGVDDVGPQHRCQLGERLVQHGDPVERREVAGEAQEAGAPGLDTPGSAARRRAPDPERAARGDAGDE